MGMGEPLANYAAVVTALRILTDAKLGVAYSPRRITVSTVGLVPGIEKLGREDLKVNLAISLHATTDEVRTRLMPVNRSFDLAALMAAVKRYPLGSRQRVFFEYVMLEDVNDTVDDAQRLVRLLRGVKAKVNLIPFNDWEGARFRRPPRGSHLLRRQRLGGAVREVDRNGAQVRTRRRKALFISYPSCAKPLDACWLRRQR